MRSNPLRLIGVIVLAWAFTIPALQAQKFTDWSAPTNIGSVVNSVYNDQHPAISPDGLSLYFVSDRPGSAGGLDLWVSQRDSLDDPWQPPLAITPLNTTSTENAPAFSPDGHLLFFGSDRLGGCGNQDIWVSFRKDKRDDLGWQAPVNLGCVVNFSGFDDGPTYVSEEDGAVTLYFTSLNRSGGFGDWDVWAATMNADGTFNSPANVLELNSSARDTRTAISRNGNELLLTSNRSGGIGGLDIWVSTRDESGVWSTPADLGGTVNSAANDGAPALSRDGTTLFFYSNRPGGSGLNDLYVATRSKKTGD